jgi:outer membrane protein TolC
MSISPRKQRRLPARIAGGLAVPLLLPLMSSPAAAGPALRFSKPLLVAAQEKAPAPQEAATTPVPADPALGFSEPLLVAAQEKAPAPQEATTTPAAAQYQVLTLADCIRIALEQQPAIRAGQASLASADASRRAVENLRIPDFIARELPYRRQQAALGVSVAAAGLEQAQRDTAYAVTRTYYTVQLARAQQKVTADVVSELTDALQNAQRLLGKEGAPRDLTQNSVDKNRAYLRLAQLRQDEAQEGMKRAVAALREAMGVGPDFRFEIPAEGFPESKVEVDEADIVRLAVTRRGEVTQAALLAEVTCLEVQAQGTSHRPTKTTFAAVSDIHGKAVPAGVSNTEYRPGALAPEMPTTLVGSRQARMERAQDLSARASAVADKTRNLIALEAEDAFLRWQQASRQLPQAQEASKVSRKLATDTLNDFKGGQNVPYRDVLEAVILAAQAGAADNEARYRQVLALADLERVTAGGFSAGLADLPLAQAPNQP